MTRRDKDQITEDELRKLGYDYDPSDPERCRMIPVSEIVPSWSSVVSSETPPELPPQTPEEIERLTRLIRVLGPLSAAVIARLPDGSDYVVQGRAVLEAAKRARREMDVVTIPVYGLSEIGARWLRVLLECAGRDRSTLKAMRQAIVQAFPTMSPRELESIIPSVDHVTWWREKRKALSVSNETPMPLLTNSFARAPQATKVLDDLATTRKSLPPGTHSPRKGRREAWQTRWKEQNSGPLPALDEEIAIHHCSYQNLEGVVGDMTSRADCCWLDPEWGAKADERTRIAEMAVRITRKNGILVAYIGEHWEYEWETEFRRTGFYKLGSVAMLNGVSVKKGQVLTEGHGGRVGFNGATKHNAKWRHCKRTVLLMINGTAQDASRWTPRRIIDTAFCVYERKVKRHTRDWGQPLPEAVYLLERVTRAGDLVVDFCCGTGTSGVACAVLGGRRFVGCDHTREEVVYARRWLKQVKDERCDPSPFIMTSKNATANDD